MDDIGVKLQAAVSDAKTHMAKQRDEIRRLESIIEQNSGIGDALAQKDAAIAKQGDKINQLRRACVVQSTAIEAQRSEIARLNGTLLAKDVSVRVLEVERNHARTANDAHKTRIRGLETELFHIRKLGTADAIAAKDAENSMLKSGGTYVVGEAVCGTFTEACDEAYNKGVPVTIWKLVLQPVCRWVNA